MTTIHDELTTLEALASMLNQKRRSRKIADEAFKAAKQNRLRARVDEEETNLALVNQRAKIVAMFTR